MTKIESKLAEMVGKKENYSLEDVLLVIHIMYCDFIMVDTQGRFVKKLLYNIYEETNTVWQLNKPFHLQSQETKDFIGKLLN